MTMEGVVTYPFAYNDQNEPVCIDDVNEENRHSTHYRCYGCGREMFAVLGKVKQSHFRHEKECECDGDKALRDYSKAAFKKRFEEEERMMITYEQLHVCRFHDSCRFNEVLRTTDCQLPGSQMIEVNLKQYFDTCIVDAEVPEAYVPNGKSYRADVLLKNSQNKDIPMIAIFFYVKKKFFKLEKIPGVRTIVMQVEDETSVLRELKPTQRTLETSFYNFANKTKADSFHILTHAMLVDGEYVGETLPCYKESECKNKAQFEIVCFPQAIETLGKIFITSLYRNNYIFQDCMVCKNARKMLDGSLECRLDKKYKCTHDLVNNRVEDGADNRFEVDDDKILRFKVDVKKHPRCVFKKDDKEKKNK